MRFSAIWDTMVKFTDGDLYWLSLPSFYLVHRLRCLHTILHENCRKWPRFVQYCPVLSADILCSLHVGHPKEGGKVSGDTREKTFKQPRLAKLAIAPGDLVCTWRVVPTQPSPGGIQVEGGHGGYSYIAAEKTCHPRCIEGKIGLSEPAIKIRVKGASTEGLWMRDVHLCGTRLRCTGPGETDIALYILGAWNTKAKSALHWASSGPVTPCYWNLDLNPMAIALENTG